MNPANLTFIHRYLPVPVAAGGPSLLLLHGTGGDEDSLLSLRDALAPGAAALSPRGKVLENGMPRFFRRLAEGVLDEADLRLRTAELADFVDDAAAIYGWTVPGCTPWATRTEPISRPACCCCARGPWLGPCCCGPWYRCARKRQPTWPGRPSS